MKKFLILLILACGLGGALWWRMVEAQPQQSAEAPATVPVSMGDVEVSVLATGSIESEQLVSVIARQSGQLQKLDATLGQDVKAGDILAQLESSDQESAVKQAEADLAIIAAQTQAKNASLTQLNLSLDRARQLAERNLGSQGDLENAEASVAMAEADLAGLAAQRARAEVALDDAKLALDRMTIRAPMDGTVVTIIASEGQMLATSQDGSTILKLADMTKMVAKVEVSEADVIRVAAGQDAKLTLLGDQNSGIEATVRMVEPAPTSLATSDSGSADQAVYYNAVLDVANTDGKLRIGMTVQATIILQKSADVLTILSSALGKPSRDGIYTVEVWNPTAKSREERQVQVGLNNNITAEITAGLTEGELVVADRASGGRSAAIDMRRRGGLGF